MAPCCDAIQLEPRTFELTYVVEADFGGITDYTDKRVVRTVRPFVLDRFEVTVGRFSAFIVDYDLARKPAEGAGAHPAFPGSGWNEEWSASDGMLPPNVASLQQRLRGRGERLDLLDDITLPVRGVSWYIAAAFCIWDGGRLPTEAEWAFAASAGEDREFPWLDGGEPKITGEHAAYVEDTTLMSAPAPVGTHSAGRGPFGHDDLAGNVTEWVADTYRESLPTSCDAGMTIDRYECLQHDSDNEDRVLRGGSYDDRADQLRNRRRSHRTPSDAANDYGIRCARDLPAPIEEPGSP